MGKGKDTDLTYAEMEKVAGDLIKDMHELEDKIKNIEKRVSALVEEGFTTQKASGAYDDSMKDFTKGATKTIQGLHGLSDFLKKAKEAYEQLDDQLAKQAKG
ncbi:WXG100 family type VII secretion target [Streptomyces sp. NPDC048409]|jgi:WXG100 family type VII secretion target|uniref:WXG100 family type VII secretion target n=1 Tax=Streptomyces TaxID=1883 RepID=UPI0033319B59